MGVTLADCQAAKTKQLKKNPDMKLQLGAATCIQQIVDESDNSAALWFEFANTGALKGTTFKVRGAARYTFDGNAKITSYHTVYDTYNLLHHGENTLSVVPNSEFSSAAMAVFCVGALAATVYVITKP